MLFREGDARGRFPFRVRRYSPKLLCRTFDLLHLAGVDIATVELSRVRTRDAVDYHWVGSIARVEYLERSSLLFETTRRTRFGNLPSKEVGNIRYKVHPMGLRFPTGPRNSCKVHMSACHMGLRSTPISR